MGDLRILFIGGVIPRDIDRAPVSVIEFGSPDYAADAYQWNLITGLERRIGSPVTLVNAPFVSAGTRRPNRIILPPFRWSHGESGEDSSVGFVNIPGLRNISREWAIKRPLREWLAAREGDAQLLVIAYSFHGPFLQQFALIKRLRPDALICLVIPDLPEHMRDQGSAGLAYRLMKRIDMRRNRDCLRHADRFVLISAHMAGALGLEPERCMVIEGVVDTLEDSSDPVDAWTVVPGPTAFTIVYTGTLSRRYGLEDLVDSLVHIDREDVRMVLCGDGDARKYVERKSKEDPRIQFLGQVSRQESLKWQRRADLLVNPRRGTGEFTKYSFPSKNLEYLHAGKPVLTYPNAGIPTEYDEYLMYIPRFGPRAIAESITRVMEMPIDEREAVGRRAQAFVWRHKSVDRRIESILKFVGWEQ
jgi:glycosyltransferase involved in cell wall biosynthesis